MQSTAYRCAVPRKPTATRGNGKNESGNDKIKASPFCESCTTHDPGKTYSIAQERGIFVDRHGLRWVCSRPLTCEHSIIVQGRIHGCTIRIRNLRNIERGRPDD